LAHDACGACGSRCAPGQLCAWGACACAPGRAACGGRGVDVARDTDHCGACDRACPRGQDCAGGACVSRVAPRPLWPPSGAVLGTRRPAFRWLPAAGEVAGRVELCRDRACASSTVLTAAGASASPPVDLAAGVHFWRVRSVRADGGEATSATWAFQLTARAGAGGGLLGHFVDVNGDGFADHVRRGDGDEVCVRFGGGGGLGALRCVPAGNSPVFAPRNNAALALGDFDGDGDTDVATRLPGADAPAVVLRGGPSGLSPPARFWDEDGPWPTPPPNTEMLGLGDVDGDGYGDLALDVDRAGPHVLAIHGGPEGTPWLPRHLLSAARGEPVARAMYLVNVGDVDGDGHGDLLAAFYDSAWALPRRLFAGAAGGPSGALAWSLEPRTSVTAEGAAGDFDGDGVGDLGFFDPSRLDLWRGGPAGLAAEPDRSVAVREPWRSPIGSFDGGRDLDGDGRSDVVYLAERGTALVVHLGAAGGVGDVAQRLTLNRLPGSALVEWLGDVDRDGHDDVLVSGGGPPEFLYRGGPGGLAETPSPLTP
ncbi:MAG: FG-GAP-like repeat-containing protein, partial [Polyangiales bacterium]